VLGEGQGREEAATFSACPEKRKTGGTLFRIAV